jgi:hypothetical protein
MKPLLPTLAVALAASGIAHAATNGTEGPNSTATVDMSLTVSDPAPFIRISGLQDLDFDLAPNTPFIDGYEVCVYVSEPSVNYDLTLDGGPLTDTQNVFDYELVGSVVQGNMSSLAYFYATATDSGPKTFFDLTPSNMQDCSDGTKLSVGVTIPGTSVKTSGQAKATVTMTVEPE